MFNFEAALKLISAQTVICVGDLMLDDFVYGEVSRISPEAPAPVLAVTKSEVVVGGAGNVARNIAALGARCIFIGVVGDDDAGRTLAAVAWTEADLKGLPRMEQASKAGQALAQRAKEAGIERAVFDRGGYRYHGRVKALAEGAREGGLAF